MRAFISCQKYCIKCKRDSLYFMDKYNRATKLNQGNEREITHMECPICGTIYDIKWKNSKPSPIYNKKKEEAQFMKLFR